MTKDSKEELKKHQPSMTVEQQIENLKSLGLVINDENAAKETLNNISYFRIIKAFSLNLKSKNGAYNQNITFEHIVRLYLFNVDLRQLLFQQIEKIEIAARCRIANYFSETYGVLGYKDKNNFQNTNYHKQFLDDVKEEINRNSRSPFVKNFRENYEGGDLPFYALVEILSFGALSKFYKNMKNSDKKAVSNLYGIGYTYYESWIEAIAYVRNICAHYGRLYNAKLTKQPSIYKEYTAIGIENNRIFAVLLCMKYLLKNDSDWILFVRTLKSLICKYPEVEIDTMGFPNNWEDELTA